MRSISTYANLDQDYRIREYTYTSASPASERSANGYDLFDMLGNVGEYSENYMPSSSPIIVYGGSYLGSRKFHDDPAIGFGDAYGEQSLFDLYAEGPADGISPAVGFRCFVKAE